MTLPKRRNPLAFPRPVEPVYPPFHPLNRDTYGYDFDLIAEIREHRYDYQAVQGDPWITMYNFPNYLSNSVDRVRVRARKPGEPKPSAYPVIACCIERGVQQLSEYNDIAGLIEVKSKFDNIEHMTPLAEEFYGWWQMFKIGAPDSVRSGSIRQNVPVPTHIKATLHDLAGELGMSDSSLAVLAVMQVMAECPAAVRPDHMTRTVEEFMTRVSVRKDMADWWFSRPSLNVATEGGQ
jgi:hypothetical protein